METNDAKRLLNLERKRRALIEARANAATDEPANGNMEELPTEEKNPLDSGVWVRGGEAETQAIRAAFERLGIDTEKSFEDKIMVYYVLPNSKRIKSEFAESDMGMYVMSTFQHLTIKTAEPGHKVFKPFEKVLRVHEGIWYADLYSHWGYADKFDLRNGSDSDCKVHTFVSGYYATDDGVRKFDERLLGKEVKLEDFRP